MTQSFGIVEEKLCETKFFLDRLRISDCFSFDARCYFSAFVSAARSVTLALQATLSGIDGFELWYRDAQTKLKADPLAPFFIEIRNDAIHKGLNPLNQVTLDHLREDLSHQKQQHKRSHVLVIPDMKSTVLVDAVQASTLYFISLVNVIFECYGQFRYTVDPQWYFTRENFVGKGKTLEDAVAELGFPPAWAAYAPKGDDGWRVLRLHQPACMINDLFRKYIGREILGPDDLDGTTT